MESKMNKKRLTFNFLASKFNFRSILKIFDFKVKKYIFENRIKNEQE